MKVFKFLQYTDNWRNLHLPPCKRYAGVVFIRANSNEEAWALLPDGHEYRRFIQSDVRCVTIDALPSLWIIPQD